MWRPKGHDLAPMTSRSGAHVHDPIRGTQSGLVMFHHNYRVAQIPKASQGFKQFCVVSRMQPDRRFVEHIEHASQARAQLRSKPNSLGLAP